MGTVPSGVSDRTITLTFLFTDVVGSTPRWERDAAEMGGLLAQHDAALTSMIESNGGVVFATGGDGFSAAFTDAVSALRRRLRVKRTSSCRFGWGYTRGLRRCVTAITSGGR